MTTAVRSRTFPRAPASVPVELLAGLAEVVSGSADAEPVLRHVARVARELLGADRATVLLHQAPGRLVPAVSVARSGADAELWTRFQSMPPISLDVSHGGDALLLRGEVIVIDDVRSCRRNGATRSI